MKAHALSLSFFLAVLPALSHPVAVPAAEAQQSQESWQLPWSGSSRPVHAYRGPVREEFLQCDQGQCPLPVHDGAAPADGHYIILFFSYPSLLLFYILVYVFQLLHL